MTESLTKKLEDLREEIAETAIVTSTVRKQWLDKVDKLLTMLDETGDDEDDDEEDDEDDEPAAEGDSYLSPKAVFQVAHALGRPRWQVEEEPEDAVLDLCEKVLRRGR